MIVCGQAAHIWVCRTTTVSIFQHGVFTNKITNIGVVVALLLGCFVTYCPGKTAALILCQTLQHYPLAFSLLRRLTFLQPSCLFISLISIFILSIFSCAGLQTIVQSANPNSLLILYASLFVSFALW
jgi:Cation transporting ATPase, C-terminus